MPTIKGEFNWNDDTWPCFYSTDPVKWNITNNVISSSHLLLRGMIFQTRVFFHTHKYLWNEVSEPPNFFSFFAFLTLGDSLPDCSKSIEKCVSRIFVRKSISGLISNARIWSPDCKVCFADKASWSVKAVAVLFMSLTFFSLLIVDG